jgi:hypothetical protein
VNARSPLALVPLAGLLLHAAPALAQDVAPPPPAPAPCTVIVVMPGAPQPLPSSACASQPQPLPPGAYAPLPPPPGAAWDPPGWAYAPPQPPRSQTAFSMKLWAGPGYQRLYDLDIWGADFGVSLGGRRGISTWSGEMQGFIGRTAHGLPVYEYWMGPTWEATLDRVHLGLGLHFGWTGIGRVTTGDLIEGLGFGIFAFASVDLYRSDDGHALYLSGRMTGNWVDGGDTTASQFGPSAALGWRY